MAQAAWEKPTDASAKDDPRLKLLNRQKRGQRLVFLTGGLLILGAIAYLVASGTLLGARFFISVEELLANPDYVGQSVRITGSVVGETIFIDESDPDNTVIQFTIAHVPVAALDNLAEALHVAANSPTVTRLDVYVTGQPKPELLQHEAQAILTGTLGSDGVFYATQLQFRCPSRFEESGPIMGEMDHPGMRSLPEASAGHAG